MLRIVTCLWHDPKYRWNDAFIYGAEHVNRLARGIARNLTLPHEFVCVTDIPEGIDPSIRIVPLWSDNRDMGGCYVRLKLFAPEMREIIGPRFAQIDLDSVPVGNLDDVLGRSEDFIVWRDVNPPTPYCGSMFMMNAGARSQVWTEFDREKSPACAREKGYVGTDQAWIGASLGKQEATWGPEHGVLSYRRDIPGMRETLPAGAKIVFFHGKLDPSEKRLQERSPWIAKHWV
jgi:hypothetical protein